MDSSLHLWGRREQRHRTLERAGIQSHKTLHYLLWGPSQVFFIMLSPRLCICGRPRAGWWLRESPRTSTAGCQRPRAIWTSLPASPKLGSSCEPNACASSWIWRHSSLGGDHLFLRLNNQIRCTPFQLLHILETVCVRLLPFIHPNFKKWIFEDHFLFNRAYILRSLWIFRKWSFYVTAAPLVHSGSPTLEHSGLFSGCRNLKRPVVCQEFVMWSWTHYLIWSASLLSSEVR